jgi:hypothetical protein
LIDWSLMGMMPSRDPNDDEDDAEEEDGDAEPDEDPAVVREPDECHRTRLNFRPES